MRAAVIVIGIIAQMVAWWRISSGRVTVWQLMPFVLGAMGISIPLLAIAAIFTGLAGVIVVCAALAVIAVVSAR